MKKFSFVRSSWTKVGQLFGGYCRTQCWTLPVREVTTIL